MIDTAGTDFPLENIPFGIFSTATLSKRPGTAIGSFCVDLRSLEEQGKIGVAGTTLFATDSLAPFMQQGRKCWQTVRKQLQALLAATAADAAFLAPLSQAKMHLPCVIGDYTDFYASKEHAVNIGTMFRGKENALMPNWVHIPVGYHGRASSVVVSGTELRRPSGQVLDADKKPVFRKCAKLDIELEMGFIVGVGNELGEPIDIKNAHEHVFGAVLLNDWSARDIQQFEYVPLGPFLGKNFGTTISGWIVTMEALEPFRCPSIVQDPVPCEYLRGGPNDAYDVQLAVEWHVGGEKQRVATSNLKYLYWSIYQQLSHHTVNGCNMRTGDLLGTGTISGPGAGESGSFLELTMNGANSVQVGSHTRTWVENGDAISLIAQCQNSGVRLGFGECIGSIRK